jgi:uncharacterized protein DUF5329
VRQRLANLRLALVAWLLLGTCAALAQTGPGVEQHKIDYLIQSVAHLQGAQFIRNGSTYDTAAAVRHLELKRRYAGDRVRTAEDFIRLCATGSSISGRPYTIRFADGHVETSASWLRARLAQWHAGAVTSASGSPATSPPR